jgi:CHAT domain-containing protein
LIAYGHYADLLAAGGESMAAVFYGKCAVNLAQEIRNNVSALGRAVQKSFLSKRQHLYRDLADRLIAAGRLAEAEQVMTMLKEEEFFDFVRVALRTEDGGATRADFSAIERPYADELRGSLSRLATAARNFRAPADDSSEKAARRSALSGEQGALRAMLGSITRALAHKSPSRRPSKSAPHGREDIAPAAARVRYLVTEQRVRMIVATSTETIDQQVNVDLSRLNRLVFEFRQALQTPKQNPLTIANTLHRLLIEPLQAVLARNNVVSLEFEPDGVLRYLPFSALYDGESYLIERFDIKQRTPVNSGQRALATSAQRLAGFGVSKAMAGFPALPSVGAELDRIVRRGPDDREGVMPGILVMDEAFTELSLRSALAKDYSLVHIASHFAFRPGPLSDSHLLLGDGKLLTLERLRDGGISLANVRLLTLSACSTAMGEAAANGGELESFGVLAQRLGAREVLASLWPVADRSTSMLMLNMYRGLGHSKTSTARALRRAQLNLLRGERHFAPYAHPFYWAPFILMSSAPDRKVQAP